MSARIDTAAERAKLDGLTGHDPAPWCTEYDEWDGRYVTTLERLNETLVPIAKVGVDYDEPFKSRQQACASLIAAAPDLLVGYRAAPRSSASASAAVRRSITSRAARMRERAAGKAARTLLAMNPQNIHAATCLKSNIRALPLREPGAT